MKNFVKNYIHYVIGLAIMFAFRFIPVGVLPNVTPVGLQVLGIFIGTLYLWTTVDPLTSSLISLCMIGLSDYAPAAGVLQQAFGTPVVVQLFFLMIFIGGLTNRKLTVYIARWIMTRKFIEGKPWVFTFVMLFGSFLISAFINAFAPILLFWPVLYGVFKDVGYTRNDKYPKIMLIAIVVAALIGFPVPPYMSNGLALLGNFRGLLEKFPVLAAMPGVMISNATYFLITFSLGTLLVLVSVLIMKYVFRPDVTPLKSVSIEMLNRNPLPPMNQAQKIYGVFLGIFIFVMLVPSLLPTLPVLSYLNANSIIIGTVLVAILCTIKTEDGPVMKLADVMGKDFAWPTYYLCVAAILIGSVLTAESTGITPFLNAILIPVFGNMSGMMFTIVLLSIAVVLTNVSNSLVIGMILQPVVCSYCAQAGVNPAPIITLLIFTVLMTAACTPAASPFAAMMFGNKEWLDAADVYKYAPLFAIIELIIVLVIGLPMATMLF